MTPYVYQIKFVPTNQIYIGCQYANNANPENLWVTYFTSSKRVKQLIKEFGLTAWVVEKIIVCHTKKEAVTLEGRMQLAADRASLINRRINNTKFNLSGPFSDEHCLRISEGKKGGTSWTKGRKLSDVTKEKISKTRSKQGFLMSDEAKESMKRKLSILQTGRIKSELTKQRISESKTGRKLGPQNPEHVRKRIESRLATLKKRKQECRS